MAAGVVVAAGAFAYLQHTEPPWYARLWYPLRYATIVRTYAQQQQIDPALLAAVIDTESKFNADARSSAGAVGLMQLTPATAEGIAEYTHGSKFQLSDLTNPDINVRYGSWYLHRLLDHYNGNEQLALAAYNAGEANVDSWVAKNEGIQFSDTRAYVAKIERLKGIYRKAYASELGY
ncbi:MAG: lytic transglycosylase domain-containing protein [Actinobacteria bacterium]|nr:lytic transglycosylase domain-containing protein [Actinomycetota bacterium]